MENIETTPLRVLIYTDREEFVAHVLELDLVGTGATPDKAQEQLLEAIGCHLSFCDQMKTNPFRKAPQEFIDAWEANQKSHLFPTVARTPQKMKTATATMVNYRRDNTVLNQFAAL